MTNPPPLGPKARLAVISPSGQVNSASLSKGLRLLKRWGFEIWLPPKFGKCRYLAGTDQERAALLAKCWGKFDVLWASRGGYGCLRLLPLLDELLERPKRPFWLVGFSDITILLNYSYQRFGLVGLHAPVICSLYETSLCALATLKACLFLKPAIRLQGKGVREGEALAPLLGGNLTSLVSLLGTPWFPDLYEKILFLEEVNEDLYRVDRLLTQLYHAQVFEGIKGLVLGDFDRINPKDLEEIVTEYFEGPILTQIPIGHGVQNYPLLIGALTRLVVKKEVGFLVQGPEALAP